MTTFTESLVEIVADLSRPLSSQQRYHRLLSALKRAFPCDATALLCLQGPQLRPLAVDGLSTETLGRHFNIDEHPRLASILLSREPVRFAADSELPDPYDGLVEGSLHQLHVHDCMGVALYIDQQAWGVITLDALTPGTFDQINPTELSAFIHLAEATVKAAQLIEQLEHKVQQEHKITQAVLADSQQQMVGQSQTLEALNIEISIVSESDLTVLVCGETGVGKELVARAIHSQSKRAKQPLIYVNCAALPENLVESELFGHVKGAFSGAVNARSGKFELSDGGTLFLDEVGEIPLASQAKLLRAIQSGEIQRVGSDQHLQVDVRIVAATNRDLKEEVSAGRFRADLYHRLSVYPINVPPLRERGTDTLLLCGYFLERERRRLGSASARLTPAAQHSLLNYPWPGNIRELEHTISRALLKAKRDTANNAGTAAGGQTLISIDVQHLDVHTPAQGQASGDVSQLPEALMLAANDINGINMKAATDAFQQQLVEQALRDSRGNQAQAAKRLGLDRSNLARLIKRLNVII